MMALAVSLIYKGPPTTTMSSYLHCLGVVTKSRRPKLAGCAGPAGLTII